MFPRQFDERKAFQIPSLVTPSSMEWGQIQRAGYVSETAAISITDAGPEGLFTVEGPVEILGLYGVITAVTNTAHAENVRFTFQNGSNVQTNLTADVAITDAPLGSMVVKNAVAATATGFIKPAAASFAEVTGQKQHQGFFLNGKTGALEADKCGLIGVFSKLGVDIDFDIQFYVHWVPLVSTAKVFAGYTLIPAV